MNQAARGQAPVWWVFGGSRGTGAELVKRLAAEGRPVVAVGRSVLSQEWPQGVRAAEADVLNAGQLSKLCAEINAGDVVVSTLGSGVDATGRSVDAEGQIALMERCRVHALKRFVLATSLGCGESRAFASPRLLAAIGTVLEAKTRAEETLRKSDLSWVILRPGRLVDGSNTGTARWVEDPSVHGAVTRGELARCILEVAQAHGSDRKVYSVVDPELKVG